MTPMMLVPPTETQIVAPNSAPPSYSVRSFTVLAGAETLMIDPDQAWYWTLEWQAKEREADEDIADGHVKSFDSLEDMFAELDS